MSEFNIKTSDVTAKYGVKRTTIFYWRDNGKIEFERKGPKDCYFRESDVVDILEAKKKKKADKLVFHGIYCHICGNNTKYTHGSSFVQNHLQPDHDVLSQDYYDTYIGEDKDKYCSICQKEKKYISYDKGYFKYCSDNLSLIHI